MTGGNHDLVRIQENSPGENKKASRGDWCRFILIFTHHYSRREQLLGQQSWPLHKRPREWLHKQVVNGNSVKSGFAAGRCEVEPDGSVKRRLASSLFFCPNQGKKMVAAPRIELGTRGFSVPCSTDWAKLPHLERVTGIEPATITLATWCSTSWATLACRYVP